MEPIPREEPPQTPLSQVQRIDRACDQFEAAWKAGQRPRIDEFLAAVPPAGWPDLLGELLVLDLDYRRQLGENPTVEEYRAEYPALGLDHFAEVFARKSQPRSSQPGPSQPGPSQPRPSGPVDATLPPYETQTLNGQLPRIHYLGDYELLAEIARGGMGIVYKARQLSLNRDVAVKMILAGQLATKADHDRFRAEAQAAAPLDHPNIVPIYEVGEHEGQHYFSMGYVDGPSLSARLAEGPLPPKEAVELVATVADAVEYAHRLGVIHRDLKPSNIVIDSKGRPRVTDFGLAKRVGAPGTPGRGDLTDSGQILGTPSYMPPEQAGGQIHAVGPAADVYALGAVLYAALTGRPPFQAATSLETLKQVIEREPVPLRKLNAAVPRDVETIVLKCLEKAVPRRYATAKALADDLRRYLEGRPILARPVGRWEHAWRWCRRNPVVAALSATAVLLVVLVAVSSTAGYLSTSQALRQVVAAQRERALTQVDALHRAEISEVPYLIDDLKPFRAEIAPQLRQLLQRPGRLSEREHLRLSLALMAMVPEDRDQLPYLYDRMLSAEPAELLVIRTALLPYRDELLGRLWWTADNPALATQRFRALCALAALGPASPHWTIAGNAAADSLVAEDPHLAITWAEALRPVRQVLLPRLQEVFRDGNCDPAVRSLATSILADYAADRPQVLANLLMEADDRQFAFIFPKFKERGEEGWPRLESEVEKPLPDADDDAKEAGAKRKANAAIALLKMNRPEKVWPLLRHSPDPTVRSYLINGFAALGADATPLLLRLGQEPDVSIRRALILSLGEFNPAQFPAAEQKALIAKLLDLYQSDPDPGIRGAAEWLLRQKGWNQLDQMAGIDARLQGDEKQLQAHKGTGKRQWYINTQGQTFVILRADKPFRMGSPEGEPERQTYEVLHQQQIDRTFAFASKLVTRTQFQHFQEANPDAARIDIDKWTRSDDSPQVGVSWYDAAQYCNWLSKKEGIPKDQWCYVPNDHGKYAEGMKPVPDYLQRSGYRLPTEAEWEYACRSGSDSSRYYGVSVKLMPKYAFFWDNSDTVPGHHRNRASPVGMKKPNDDGLFDMLGNAWQWCDNIFDSSAVLEDAGTKTAVQDKVGRVLHGASFDSLVWEVRSACRISSVPTDHNLSYGFRVARTWR